MSRIECLDSDLVIVDWSPVREKELRKLMVKAPPPWPLERKFIPLACEVCNRKLCECECR